MKRFALSLLSLFPTLLLAGSMQAVSIGFSPQTTSVALGDAFAVDVVVSDLGGEIVSAYDLDIVFDASVISLDGLSQTSALGDAGLFEAFYADASLPGLVDIAGVSVLSDAALLALQGGDSVTLATLTFTKTGDGSTSLGFVFDRFNDVKGARAQILDLDVEPGRVGGQVIPEPSAAAVFGLGLLVTRWAVRRQRA